MCRLLVIPGPLAHTLREDSFVSDPFVHIFTWRLPFIPNPFAHTFTCRLLIVSNPSAHTFTCRLPLVSNSFAHTFLFRFPPFFVYIFPHIVETSMARTSLEL